MKVLHTGAAGFIGTYLVKELIAAGHQVIGIDNFSKYGEVELPDYPANQFKLVRGDAKDVDLMKELIRDCDQVIAGAAKIGGISYFHEFAYDLLAENERIMASTFDAAIWAFKNHKLKKINVLSSSMVFENATIFPTPEGHQKAAPPPSSSYGFQKLACEYYAEAAFTQYKLPYTIIRPFNCVGVGERRALSSKKVMSGDVQMTMSHVVPDIVLKILKGQYPLRILGNGSQIRHYTYGGDLAKGIRVCMESEKALNNDFNLSTPHAHTVLELAQLIWKKLRDDEFRCVSDPPYPYDVQERIPDVRKAKEVLGFEATTTLSQTLDELIPWIKEQMALGTI